MQKLGTYGQTILPPLLSEWAQGVAPQDSLMLVA